MNQTKPTIQEALDTCTRYGHAVERAEDGKILVFAEFCITGNVTDIMRKAGFRLCGVAPCTWKAGFNIYALFEAEGENL